MKARSESWQLGYSDAVKYGIARALRDRPHGTMQADYDKGYRAGQRKCATSARILKAQSQLCANYSAHLMRELAASRRA